MIRQQFEKTAEWFEKEKRDTTNLQEKKEREVSSANI